MVLLRTSYSSRYGGVLEYYFKLHLVRFGVCMIKLRHERMLILRCILPPQKKTEILPEKKLAPHHLKNLEHPDKKLKSLGIS